MVFFDRFSILGYSFMFEIKTARINKRNIQMKKFPNQAEYINKKIILFNY
jgi:hypothetical protein